MDDDCGGGQLVVGNFHPRNPTRGIMEWLGDWFLVHRDEAGMRRLAREAGIPEGLVRYEEEPLGVCGFLRAGKE